MIMTEFSALSKILITNKFLRKYRTIFPRNYPFLTRLSPLPSPLPLRVFRYRSPRRMLCNSYHPLVLEVRSFLFLYTRSPSSNGVSGWRSPDVTALSRWRRVRRSFSYRGYRPTTRFGRAKCTPCRTSSNDMTWTTPTTPTRSLVCWTRRTRPFCSRW